MKIVIDTNLLIAAFFNKKSASFKILKEGTEGKIKILWTESIKKEGEKILSNIQHSLASGSRKTRKNYRLAQELKIREEDSLDLDKVFKKENKIEKAPRVNFIKEDPTDNKFLACALKGGAQMIVTNDRHLLKIKKFKEIPTLTPIQALKMLKMKNDFFQKS